MKKTSKILATTAIVLVFLIFNALIQAGSGPGGRNPGLIGIILVLGLIVGIRAVWKSSENISDKESKID